MSKSMESPETQVFGSEEAFARIAMELMKTDKANLLSDLSLDEINLLTSLQTLADFTGSTVATSIIDSFLRFRVSKDRFGRKELMSVALAARDEPAKKSRGISSLFAGLR